MVRALSTIHMCASIRSQKKRRSGVSLIAIFFSLTLTGLGLFYLAGASLILLASTIHIIVGIVLIAIFALHVVKNKRTKGLSR